MGSRTRALIAENNYLEALHACRAEITQYTIWHKSHTEPAVHAGVPKAEWLHNIDIRAMADIVDTLLWCHKKTEMMDEFPAVLERLRDNIRDIAWQRTDRLLSRNARALA